MRLHKLWLRETVDKKWREKNNSIRLKSFWYLIIFIHWKLEKLCAIKLNNCRKCASSTSFAFFCTLEWNNVVVHGHQHGIYVLYLCCILFSASHLQLDFSISCEVSESLFRKHKSIRIVHQMRATFFSIDFALQFFFII